jgi:16S rRNA (cytidine1402-2'-O)-methyltransferase
MKEMGGVLSVVATPIGNLEDITLRAIRALRGADAVFAEDTRRARALFAVLQIPAPPLVRADEAALERGQVIRKALAFLREEKRLVYLTDAGTPGIADPGWRLVAAVRQQLPEAAIEAVPGPSALTAAVAVAGVPMERFVFFGYPPRKRGRHAFLADVAREPRGVVLFESPYRIAQTFAALAQHAPARQAFWARELTKRHETHRAAPLAELHAMLSSDPSLQKGEHTLVLAPLGFHQEHALWHTGEVCAGDA